MLSKLLEFIKTKQSEIVLAVAIILISVIAFESGKISALRQFNEPLEIDYAPAAINNANPSLKKTKTDSKTSQDDQKLDWRVVVSKNSSLYHFLWCSGAKRIKEENKITFSSEQEAQNRGYAIASNCSK